MIDFYLCDGKAYGYNWRITVDCTSWENGKHGKVVKKITNDLCNISEKLNKGKLEFLYRYDFYASSVANEDILEVNKALSILSEICDNLGFKFKCKQKREYRSIFRVGNFHLTVNITIAEINNISVNANMEKYLQKLDMKYKNSLEQEKRAYHENKQKISKVWYEKFIDSCVVQEAAESVLRTLNEKRNLTIFIATSGILIDSLHSMSDYEHIYSLGEHGFKMLDNSEEQWYGFGFAVLDTLQKKAEITYQCYSSMNTQRFGWASFGVLLEKKEQTKNDESLKEWF